jgi:hypothetical protein
MQEVIGIDTTQSDNLSLNTDSGTKKVRKEDLTEEKILASAEKYYLQTGKWPTIKTRDEAPDMPHETWRNIDTAICRGLRGLEHLQGKKQTLSTLLEPLKIKYNYYLTEEKILLAAEKYYLQTGKWPTHADNLQGSVPDMPDETWNIIDQSCRRGGRGLAKRVSLAKLIKPLKEKYGFAVEKEDLTEEKILASAEKYYLQTGKWPGAHTIDPVPDMPNVTWSAIHQAGSLGTRGLAKGRTLSEILKPLKEKYGFAIEKEDLTEEKIIESAEKYYLKTGKWPTTDDTTKGNVPDMPNETWNRINEAGQRGYRGLTKSRTLSEIIKPLKVKYGYYLNEDKIQSSAEKFYLETGNWPTRDTKDPVPDMPNDTWRNLDHAISDGLRGLPHSKDQKQSLSTLIKHLKEKYSLSLTDAPLPKEFKKKVISPPKKVLEKAIGEKIEKKNSITFVKGEAFEQLVGLVLLSRNIEERVIPQFCLDVDSEAGFFGMRADFKVGKDIYEVKWGNATGNINKTHDKHKTKLTKEQNYKLVLFEKNSELTLSHSMFEELLENSPHESKLKDISNLLLENVINPNKEFLEKLRDYLYSLNIKSNQYQGVERLELLESELAKFLASDDKLSFMKENRYALYTPLEAYFEYEGKLIRGLISPKALQLESPEAYEVYYYFDGLTFKDELVRDIAVMCELSSSFENSLLARELIKEKDGVLVNPVFTLPDGNEIKAEEIKSLEDLRKVLIFSDDDFKYGLEYLAFHGREA